MDKGFRIRINETEISGSASQDLLTSALQAGFRFPYRCRVGGCGTCKCQLVEGKVRRLTDFGYILSADEIRQGYILACQAIPETDLKIQVQPVRMQSPSEQQNLVRTRDAGVFDYAKYFLFHLVGLYSLFCLLAGGPTISWGLLLVLLFYIFGDALAGNDLSTPNYKSPKILTYQLWLALPLLILIVFGSIWSLSSEDTFGIGRWIYSNTGLDVLSARAQTIWYHHISAGILVGLMIGLIGTITAHELTHRTSDRVSMFIGRCLLAFSFDTSFAIEHVYGHHRYVATSEDPATAPRGRNVYHHVLASTVKGNISAWKIECDRLKKLDLSIVTSGNAFSIYNPIRNLFIRGHLMSLCLVLAAYAFGGAAGALFFIAVGLWGKSLLEIVNYMEHYGLVRHVDEPVRPYHSWNTNRRISSWTMFNLTRHSHHHAQGEVPYQDLRPYPDAPMMLNGYLTTIVLALIPKVWFRLMAPKLKDWDAKYLAVTK